MTLMLTTLRELVQSDIAVAVAVAAAAAVAVARFCFLADVS